MTHPIIGLEAIHRRYFVSEEGEELLSLSTLKKLSKEMQEAGAVMRFEIMRKGQKKIRIVALEPMFTLWLVRKFNNPVERDEICLLVKDTR